MQKLIEILQQEFDRVTATLKWQLFIISNALQQYANRRGLDDLDPRCSSLFQLFLDVVRSNIFYDT